MKGFAVFIAVFALLLSVSMLFAALSPPPFPGEAANPATILLKDESGTPAANVSVTANCTGGQFFSSQTDSSGSALFTLPEGDCSFSASDGALFASASNISISSQTELNLTLTLRSAPEPDFTSLILFTLLSLAVIFLVIWFGKKFLMNMKTDFEKAHEKEQEKTKEKPSGKEEKSEEPKEKPEEKFEVSPEEQAELAEPEITPPSGAIKIKRTKKMDDIIKTLEEKQAAIIEYLIAHGGKVRQSKVRYDLRIPKTSFFRLTRALENRNIIKTEKYLNTAEITLSEWFLSEK